MGKNKGIVERVEVDEDEFLLAMNNELRRLDKQKSKYISIINQIQVYKALNFDVNYFFKPKENTYEFEYEKKNKVGFEVGK